VRVRSPAEFYLKYLIVRAANPSFETIGNIFDELELDIVGEDYFKRVLERTVKPTPFHPKDKLHTRSQRFILKEGIHDIFFPDEHMRMALKVLETARAKEFVEAMILSHAPDIAIADGVSSYRGLPCSSKAIQHYKHYFWNIELLDATQMRALLNYRQEVVGSEGENASKEDKALHRAAKRASYLDPRRLAADLPWSPMTALMSQMRMGTMPGKLELATILEMARTFSSIRAAEASLYGSKDDSYKAMNFSIVAKNMTDILEKVVKPDENLQEDLRRIALRNDERSVPSIFELSDGKHTVDLQPIKGSHDDGLVTGRSEEEDGGGEEDPGGDVSFPGGG
jgi:hypothetical protein